MGKVWLIGQSLCAVVTDGVICILDGSEDDQRACLELAADYGRELEYMGVMPDGREVAIFTRKRN